jgi:hypothetical protein
VSLKSLSFMLLNKATLHMAAYREFILIFFLILNLSCVLCIYGLIIYSTINYSN